MLKLYNTLSRKKEIFKPLKDKHGAQTEAVFKLYLKSQLEELKASSVRMHSEAFKYIKIEVRYQSEILFGRRRGTEVFNSLFQEVIQPEIEEPAHLVPSML